MIIFFRPRLLASLVLLLIANCLSLHAVHAQKQYTIAEVQGDKNISPYEKQNVSVSGVVTARTSTGFFLQTPDDKTDNNPATSEGIFVFTRNEAPAVAIIGALVIVSGEVQEFRSRNDNLSLTITEISHRIGQDVLKAAGTAELPKPIVLAAADFASNKIDQLEKYEGMRVAVPELSVVAPTGGSIDDKTGEAQSDGVFYGVLKGLARPFREPGLDIREFLTSPDRDKFKSEFPKLQVFDANPEVLRIESRGQIYARGQELGDGKIAVATFGRTLNVTSMSVVKDLVGPLHYAYGKYAILPDLKSDPVVTGSIKPNPMPAPNDRQFSVVGMNIENFFDDRDDAEIREPVTTTEAFDRRLKKIALAVVDHLHLPDVIGTVEIENLAALKRLAERINSAAVAAGKPDPKYEAYLVEGNDGRGIDNGFLIKSSRVKLIEAKQFGKSDRYKNPDTGEEVFLNDRPPLMARVSIHDARSGKPFEFTAVINHLKSYSGFNDPRQMANVRMKKRLQAEFLARWVNERQKAKPDERIVLLGDFNSYQFSDGVLDMIGTIKGRPTPKGEVMIASEDLVNPDLINLVDLIDARERYSYIFDGSAQVLDHMLVTENLRKHVKGFGYLRVNADHPEILRKDDSRAERFSDHDPAVAYFSLE